MERRNFNQLFALGSLGLAFSSPITNKKISLAQWSLHRAIKINKELSPNNFSIKARAMGFNAVEYVSSLYWNELKSRSISKITKELLMKSKDFALTAFAKGISSSIPRYLSYSSIH